MATTTSLSTLVREGLWAALEEAWMEQILADPTPGPALEAIRLAAHKKEIPRCIAMVREQAEILSSQERAEEAARLLGETMLLGGSPGELGKPLYAAAEAAWGAREFWAAYVEISALSENAPDMRTCWRDFQKLLALTPGRVVYHAKGWGLAQIESLDHEAREAATRFVSGRRDRFPFQTAIDIFEFLDESDLRTLVVTDPDELTRRLKKEPLEILRWILQRNNGKATQAGIKLAMSTLGVDGARFTAWWRRTKKEAETSEWFELSGPSNRVSVRLLTEASDPVEGIKRQLRRAKSLNEALQRTRALVTGGAAQADVVAAALEALDELSRDDVHPLQDRLGTWVFLREHLGETPELLREVIARATSAPAPEDPSQTPELWRLFQTVPGSREQERCIEILRDVLGEEWLDEAAKNLQHAAAGMVRGLTESLAQAGRTPELVDHYTTLLARPARNPALLVRLAVQLETGQFDDQLPPKLRRTQCLLQLAVHLFRASPGDPVLTRTRARLTDALAASKAPLLPRLLAEADVDTLRGLASMISAGVDSAIDRVFTRIAVEHSADIFREDEAPFWELAGTWTYRSGLERRKEELRELTDVKIPANAEAIGVAASYGDLSENSEWEAAIEEQRNLTNRAMQLETEIREAHLLDEVTIPADTVAPGTRVRFRDGTGAEREIEVVGPWDVEREDQVSYRSPLAKGMLGRHPGESVTLELPAGREEVQVLAVSSLR